MPISHETSFPNFATPCKLYTSTHLVIGPYSLAHAHAVFLPSNPALTSTTLSNTIDPSAARFKAIEFALQLLVDHPETAAPSRRCTIYFCEPSSPLLVPWRPSQSSVASSTSSISSSSLSATRISGSHSGAIFMLMAYLRNSLGIDVTICQIKSGDKAMDSNGKRALWLAKAASEDVYKMGHS
ncbi:uncharacterized protein SAPINGB_P001623 [Magnusiomyces paraingens]|uniref:Uncharacterized protein n=1 Tax=Magnusiomyces paraingens TaxID=2606893 RepID=A0A5E8BCS2_9ASCO|nr:uncharacterized protein SAPINGB_P001623 [Saprochaete ingens]VVT47261.1 unnamed protein product [Saprochaete ingens]